MKLLVSLVLLTQGIIARAHEIPRPIVIWHGMGDMCCLPITTGLVKNYLHQILPQTYILSIAMGDNAHEDVENSYFMDPNEQVKYACKKIAADKRLQGGFNMIGFSQGSLLLRGVIERCGHRLPPVKNFISLGGQHQGMYGLPRCIALSNQTCFHIRELLTVAPYDPLVQSALVLATIWHDPLNEDLYKANSTFLADINNELTINEMYKSNLKMLEHFVMVKFDGDQVVEPRESEWFGFYAPGQSKKVQTLNQSRIYLEDRLGLQEMDKAGKLVFLSQPGGHLQMEAPWLLEVIAKKYLVN